MPKGSKKYDAPKGPAGKPLADVEGAKLTVPKAGKPVKKGKARGKNANGGK